MGLRAYTSVLRLGHRRIRLFMDHGICICILGIVCLGGSRVWTVFPAPVLGSFIVEAGLDPWKLGVAGGLAEELLQGWLPK